MVVQLAGALHILAGICLLAFWWLFALVLPFGRLREGIWHLARHRYWSPINLTGFAGSVFAALALVSTWHVHAEAMAFGGVVAVLAGVPGLMMLGANLAWESILWPPLAHHAEPVLRFDGPLYTSRRLLGFMVVGGLCFSAGYVAFGWALPSTLAPRWVAWLMMVGAPVFAFGPAFGSTQVWVRSAGITLLSLGAVALGIHQLW